MVESVSSIFASSMSPKKTKIIIPNTNKEIRNEKVFVPLIPFISQHWNLSVSKAQEIVHYAFLYGKKYNVSPLFILSEIATESSFRETAYSDLAAVGIMQVYPKSHWGYVVKHHYTGNNYSLLFKTKDNIRFGAKILSTDLRRFGSMNLAAAHYFGICSFDKTYVTRIDSNYKLLESHYY
jgi:soluble lytic murein transglycosylase-like protein